MDQEIDDAVKCELLAVRDTVAWVISDAEIAGVVAQCQRKEKLLWRWRRIHPAILRNYLSKRQRN